MLTVPVLQPTVVWHFRAFRARLHFPLRFLYPVPPFLLPTLMVSNSEVTGESYIQTFVVLPRCVRSANRSLSWGLLLIRRCKISCRHAARPTMLHRERSFMLPCMMP